MISCFLVFVPDLRPLATGPADPPLIDPRLVELAAELAGAAAVAASAAEPARQDWAGTTRRWFEAELEATIRGLRTASELALEASTA